MNLSDWASIASLANSIAVLISLIYLALQVRQAERNQQASIRQGRATRMEFIAIDVAFLASAEYTYLQYKEGLLTHAVHASFAESWRQTLAQPGVRALWKLRRHGFERGFVNFMDKLMAEAPPQPSSDFLAAWKSEAAAEKARGLN